MAQRTWFITGVSSGFGRELTDATSGSGRSRGRNCAGRGEGRRFA